MKNTREASPEEALASPTTAGAASGRAGLFQECLSAGLNACGEQVPEWEEIELMVDSGASATVLGADQIKAVKASELDSSRFYKIGDGSIIPHKGQKHFVAHTVPVVVVDRFEVIDVNHHK